jgi:hypothetical protein
MVGRKFNSRFISVIYFSEDKYSKGDLSVPEDDTISSN